MRKISGNPLQIEVTPGEEIVIRVAATNTVFLVNGVFDGQTFKITEGMEAAFVVDKPKHRLTLLFTFANAEGDNGRYDVRITGNGPGGETSEFTVHQQFGIPATAIVVLFRVA